MSGLLLWAVIVAVAGWAGLREERRLGVGDPMPEMVPATCENIARAERIISGLTDWLDGHVRDWPDMRVPTKFPEGRDSANG